MVTETLQKPDLQPEDSPFLDRIKQILEIPKIALAPLVGYIRLFWKKLNTPPYNWEIKLPTQDGQILIIQKQANKLNEPNIPPTYNYVIKLHDFGNSREATSTLLQITGTKSSITDVNCECQQLYRYLLDPTNAELITPFLLKLHKFLTFANLSQLNIEQTNQISELKNHIYKYINQYQPQKSK